MDDVGTAAQRCHGEQVKGWRILDIRYYRESIEEKVWDEKESRAGFNNNTLKAEKVCGVEQHVWACVIPSSLSLSSLLLCLSASICWNSTAIARRLLDIIGCPAPPPPDPRPHLSTVSGGEACQGTALTLVHWLTPANFSLSLLSFMSLYFLALCHTIKLGLK